MRPYKCTWETWSYWSSLFLSLNQRLPWQGMPAGPALDILTFFVLPKPNLNDLGLLSLWAFQGYSPTHIYNWILLQIFLIRANNCCCLYSMRCLIELLAGNLRSIVRAFSLLSMVLLVLCYSFFLKSFHYSFDKQWIFPFSFWVGEREGGFWELEKEKTPFFPGFPINVLSQIAHGKKKTEKEEDDWSPLNSWPLGEQYRHFVGLGWAHPVLRVTAVNPSDVMDFSLSPITWVGG